MKNILVPLLNEDGLNSKISEHFGHAPFFAMYNFETNELKIVENKINHNDSEKSAIHQLKELFNPECLFVKSIGRKAIDNAKKLNIDLKSGEYQILFQVIENKTSFKNTIRSCC